MKENTPDDLIHAYLTRKLDRADLENFEKLLDSDPELAHAVALRRTEMAASELLIASETRQLFKEWREASPMQRTFPEKRMIAWLTGIAAGLLLLAAAIQLFQRPSESPAIATPTADSSAFHPDALPDTLKPVTDTRSDPPKAGKSATNYGAMASLYMETPKTSGFRQTSADSTTSIFQQAQQAYDAGYYQQTLDLLAQTDSTRLQSATFLSAHALFRLQRFAEAETRFSRVIGWNSRQFRYQSEWGLLMCRLADFPQRKKEVRQQLNGILAKPGHPYREKAEDLQKTLKD